MEAFLHPHLSAHVQSLIRAGYGVLLFCFLLQTLPVARWFFVSDRWRGYAKSGPLVDLLQNPVSMGLLMALWMACAAALAAGVQTVLAAFLNLLLCRYFFVHMRWKGVLRGGGAPGFMSYWWAAVVFLLEYTSRCDPVGPVRSWAILVPKVDLAFIMLSAGLYKALAGYPRNEGMELGVVNPWWGYWWKLYRNLPPGSFVFKGMNHLAYLTELGAGVLLLFPPTQIWGALALVLSFLFICSHIRLGFLTEMVMLTGLLYVEAGTGADRWLAALPAPPSIPSMWLPLPPAAANTTLAIALVTYLVLLVPAHAGLYYNFLARRRLPGFLQIALERYTNFFGIIIWRVFTIDVINFFVRIHIRNPATGESREYTRFDFPDARSRFRYWHVSEFVCFASVFTTLKYYPDNRALFEERLLRYARTLPCAAGELLRFEYVSIRKTSSTFEFVPAAEFEVDPATGRVREQSLDASVDVRAAHRASPVHAGAKPGSYAPAARG